MPTTLFDMTFIPTESARALQTRLGIDQINSAVFLADDWREATPTAPEKSIQLSHIPGFSPAEGGKLHVFRSWSNSYVAVVTSTLLNRHPQNRFAVELMAEMGVKNLVLTASGSSLNPNVRSGSVVMVADHLNLTGSKPEALGAHIDTSKIYSARLKHQVAAIDPSMRQEVVLAQVDPPLCETPAERRMLLSFGADVIATRIARSALVAHSRHLDVLGLVYLMPELGERRRALPRLTAITSGLIAAL